MQSRANGKLASAAALATALACVGPVPATAHVFKGNGKANKVSGTKRADVIRLGAGNDRASGRGGADRINGGSGRDVLSGGTGKDRIDGSAGNDRVVGGTGADRLAGGAGGDRIDSVDGARDGRVDGGPGANVCRVDAADLSVVRRCARLTVVGVTGGSGGGGTGTGTPGDGAGGGDAALALTSATGLSCGSALPICAFGLAGTGADTSSGTVTGGGGAQLGAGAVLAPSPPAWTANGLYGCSSDGYLRVSVGDEQLDVPVDCTG